MNDPYLQTFSKQHNTLHKISPIPFVRASKQYLYDDQGVEYLDCISNISHVGHCHPRVVDAARIQMSKMTTSVGLLCETQVRYIKRLVETLPEQLCVCFLVNSGSEANDIALRLARSYTGNEDVVVIDKAYYGALSSLVDISPYKFGNSESKEGVQVVPLPDTYRGLYREEHHNVGELYALDAEKVVARALLKGRKIACFISEPIIVSAGVIIPPKNYLKHIYSYIRGIGGVCIADEVQSGLSRTGEHFWAFQSHDVVPDIVTVGRPLGNGHPMAAVFTTREIGDKLTDFVSSFGGNPVSCAIGSAVLDVMYNEKLMLAAKCVGQCLMEELKKLKTRHTCIGDISCD
ncbi:ethanolamine-phosphate phospho-lyase-like [Limulus polyphemus]|uniref:Ethanolamine-phosphate phospho-lyase-like n=1 Tax=Limulus polyphemus TaxID=6850 RepID=A0ABM1SBL4_LIMPO|nr:ethanolamine-phosphate phospho-lyase-like [Limulus polyphemus]XP_022241019.1 ethanolamine-phosphate phospho-lyase-like [Limulus polyphemus]XP_022241020.1 ethanolamine-phosphate phospho-lyase-like [Limulus polyphemus]XP_022241022.1 ethanolamine-phosphate phospho-lyase-like [Limulus polyphemus]